MNNFVKPPPSNRTAETPTTANSDRLRLAGDRLAPALLSWFDTSGRKHLPWQQHTTSYRVWVSEIMLQQTQVTTVIPYYERFMARFPDMHALAAAPIDEVLHLWTGLGYYARARNLHRTAQLIVDQYDGIFPVTLESVQALSGIGRSTAGAILALSQAQRHPILDGNVKRVLARYFGVAGFTGEQKIERDLWRWAEACTPHDRIANYTQAIMDLGATVCVRSRPLCAVCPLTEYCVARIEGLQAVLPTPKPKKTRPQRTAHVVIAMNDAGAVLLERRPPAGIWGGLWTFPQFDDQPAALRCVQQWGPLPSASAIAPAAAEASLLPIVGGSLPDYHHSFTHFDLTLRPILVRVGDASRFVADSERHLWYDPRQPAKIGLAKPTVELLRQLVCEHARTLESSIL